ncbi:MAG: class I SAM-dependent methyltransferase [Candidatus Woesearchaeota archaeon]
MENRGIATLFNDDYSKSAPKVLGDQHSYLLDCIEKHLSGITAPVLLVIGPGGRVLPYSCTYTNGTLGGTNRDRIKKMIGKGKIILADYILEYDKSGLIKGLDTLTEMGFFEQGYFKTGCFVHTGNLCPIHLWQGTISFLKNNLHDDLHVASESVDAVDANLSIHHASVTRAELHRIYGEIHRVLKPGGMLHLGEGNVNMNYTEDKLVRIGQDVCEYLKAPVHLEDRREEGNKYVIYAKFLPGKKYECLPAFIKRGDECLPADVVDNQGIVRIKSEEPIGMMRFLISKGYGNISTTGATAVEMPLIDSSMPEDVAGHIAPVDAYYDAIRSRTNAYKGIDDELAERISRGIEDEREKAKKGIVEYYMGEQQILDALENTGFTNIRVKHHETEPFYNITAIKK